MFEIYKSEGERLIQYGQIIAEQLAGLGFARAGGQLAGQLVFQLIGRAFQNKPNGREEEKRDQKQQRRLGYQPCFNINPSGVEYEKAYHT